MFFLQVVPFAVVYIKNSDNCNFIKYFLCLSLFPTVLLGINAVLHMGLLWFCALLLQSVVQNCPCLCHLAWGRVSNHRKKPRGTDYLAAEYPPCLLCHV